MNKIQIKARVLERLKLIIKSHPNLRYILHFVKNFGNKDIYEYMFPSNIYPSYFKLNQYGLKNKDKNIFLISIVSPRTGIGCYIRDTVLALYSVDKLRFIPVVEWTGESWLREDYPVNGSNNYFEYYFNQVSDVLLNDVYKSACVFTDVNRSALFIGAKELNSIEDRSSLIPYIVDEDYLTSLGFVYKKYLHLNAVVRQYMNESFTLLFGKKSYPYIEEKREKVLGLHIRGTDFALHWENHPNMVTPEQYADTIDFVLSKDMFSKIFVATDDQNCLTWFISKYGDGMTSNGRIIYFTDVYRGTGLKNIAAENVERENSHYLSGLEVLRDIYTLAECDGLVCGLSQVSICARIVNRAEGKKYIFEKVLNNGIYHSK